MNKFYRTRVIAESYDFEKVRELMIFCSCETAIPNETVERLICEPDLSFFCRTCGMVSKLTLAELDSLADSLALSIEELCVNESKQKALLYSA